MFHVLVSTNGSIKNIYNYINFSKLFNRVDVPIHVFKRNQVFFYKKKVVTQQVKI